MGRLLSLQKDKSHWLTDEEKWNYVLREMSFLMKEIQQDYAKPYA